MAAAKLHFGLLVFTIALPFAPGASGPERRADVVDGTSTPVQRDLRRGGLASVQPMTMAALMTVFENQPPGFAFFDVGAGIGLSSMLCELLFDPGAVVSFEPANASAEIARRIVKANGLRRMTVHEQALGASPVAATPPVRTIDDFVTTTGVVPDVIKIDVGGREPDVVRGALATLRDRRPSLVVEVRKGRKRDRGAELTSIMRGLGYRYYRLGAKPRWQPRSQIVGQADSDHRDWLLVPDVLDSTFGDRHRAWLNRIATCTASRNSRLPIVATAIALRRERGTRATGRLVGEQVVLHARRLRTRLR